MTPKGERKSPAHACMSAARHCSTEEVHKASTYCAIKVPTILSLGEPGRRDCPLPPRCLQGKRVNTKAPHNAHCCSKGTNLLCTALGTMQSQQEKCGLFSEIRVQERLNPSTSRLKELEVCSACSYFPSVSLASSFNFYL